jgi:hypothetical protein
MRKVFAELSKDFLLAEQQGLGLLLGDRGLTAWSYYSASLRVM